MSKDDHYAFVNSFKCYDKLTHEEFDASHDGFLAFCQRAMSHLNEKLNQNNEPKKDTTEHTK